MSEKREITQEDRKELIEQAYTMGYECYEYTWTEWGEMLQESDNPRELWANGNEDTYPICELACEGQGKNSQQRAFWAVEDHYDLGDNEGWDSAGIYGVIEDVSVAWEAGAYDALLEKDYDLERVEHLYNY